MSMVQVDGGSLLGATSVPGSYLPVLPLARVRHDEPQIVSLLVSILPIPTVTLLGPYLGNVAVYIVAIELPCSRT